MPDPIKYDVTELEAAVIDAITESMNEPDAVHEARALIAALKESGFVVIRDPNRPRNPSGKARAFGDQEAP